MPFRWTASNLKLPDTKVIKGGDIKNDLRPAPRGGHACVALSPLNIVIHGGADRSSKVYNDTWLLTCEGDGSQWWTRIKTGREDGKELPARTGATMTLVGTILYIYGGQNPATGAWFDDLVALSTTTWRWAKVEGKGGMQPPRRHSHTTVLLNDRYLFVFGGAGEDGVMADVWLFDTHKLEWTMPIVTGEGPNPREMHTATLVSSTHCVIYGGRSPNNEVLSDAYIFNGTRMQWQALPPLDPIRSIHPARCAHAAVRFQREQRQEAAVSIKAEPDSGVTGESAGPPAKTQGLDLVLVYGGFDGKKVVGSVMTIDPESAGRETAKVNILHRGPTEEVFSSKDPKEIACPLGRFAHSAAAVESFEVPGRKDIMFFGGINMDQDFDDLLIWAPSAVSAAAPPLPPVAQETVGQAPPVPQGTHLPQHTPPVPQGSHFPPHAPFVPQAAFPRPPVFQGALPQSFLFPTHGTPPFPAVPQGTAPRFPPVPQGPFFQAPPVPQGTTAPVPPVSQVGLPHPAPVPQGATPQLPPVSQGAHLQSPPVPQGTTLPAPPVPQGTTLPAPPVPQGAPPQAPQASFAMQPPVSLPQPFSFTPMFPPGAPPGPQITPQ